VCRQEAAAGLDLEEEGEDGSVDGGREVSEAED